MAEYLAPGVYIEDLPGNPSILGVASSIGGMVGVTERGTIGKPTYLTSWDAFLREFAQGVASPFIANSDLAYAVYGFFQNGGTKLYVSRIASSTAAVAEADATNFNADDDEPVIEAKDEGAWGNALTLTSTVNEDITGAFDVAVLVSGEVMEFYTALVNDPTEKNYWIDTINAQSYLVKAVSGTLTFTSSPVTFSGGVDGIEDVTDQDYIDDFPNWDVIQDVTLFAVPGQTSAAMNAAIMSYCENRKDLFAMLDAPVAATVESVRELRKTTSSKCAAMFYPWIRVSDPLSKAGKLRDCPVVGHAMGVYARVIAERGVWKAPAGTEANIRGALEVLTTLTKGDMDVLNPIGIICIYPKTNYGIVIWGARCITPDTSMLYVSDVLLDIYIKKSVESGTQSFVFEPNNSKTWSRVQTAVEGFLDTLWRDGGLYGTSAAEAYRVRCDEELNPEASRNQGRLICEVAYAPNKPSEFVIFRFSHTLANNS